MNGNFFTSFKSFSVRPERVEGLRESFSIRTAQTASMFARVLLAENFPHQLRVFNDIFPQLGTDRYHLESLSL